MAHAVAQKQCSRQPSFPTVRQLSPDQLDEKSQTMAHISSQRHNSAVHIVDEEEKSHIKSGEYNIISKASLNNRL